MARGFKVMSMSQEVWDSLDADGFSNEYFYHCCKCKACKVVPAIKKYAKNSSYQHFIKYCNMHKLIMEDSTHGSK